MGHDAKHNQLLDFGNHILDYWPVTTIPPDRIAALRHFNRLYTRRIGALEAGHLGSPFSLSEARVLYEIAHGDDDGGTPPTASALGRALGLDAGYLSRMLRDFSARGLIERSPSPTDGRQQLLRLTDGGRDVFGDLNTRAVDDVASLLAALPDAAQQRLVAALRVAESLIADTVDAPNARASRRGGASAFVLRPARPGDYGWVIARHGALYAQEYQWDERFEALVARIVADYIEQHDTRREYCWIAERDGLDGPENIGSVFLVRHPDRAGVAKLRLLLVEPTARGLGVGRRLVDECSRFARLAGYHTITLWTNSILTSAIHIYASVGYTLVAEEPHHSFGHDLVGQTWELTL